MDILSVTGAVLFTAAVDTVRELVVAAVVRRADLRGADLYGANLYGANLRGANLRGADLRGADLYGANLYGANLRGANLRGADLRGANLYGADLYGTNLHGANLRGANGNSKKVCFVRAYSSSLYPYIVLAVLFEDGERMVKMGCLEKTLAEWKNIGIRNSNLGEFPNDGSDICEDRVGLFNLARAAVRRMKLPVKDKGITYLTPSIRAGTTKVRGVEEFSTLSEHDRDFSRGKGAKYINPKDKAVS